MAQILRACSQLEELTLHNCTHVAGGYDTHYSSPLLGATVALLHAAPSRDLDIPAPWRAGYRGLRELVLRWDASQQHADLTRYMLRDLAPIPSVSVHADSVMLRVPRVRDKLPAALTIVARSVQLVRGGSAADVMADMASFSARCQLVVEGVRLDDLVANWVPFTQTDRVEKYYGYDSEGVDWDEDGTVDAATDVDEY